MTKKEIDALDKLVARQVLKEMNDFDDIDIAFGYYYEPYGIIKLRRDNGQTKLNGKNIQPPKSKL